MDFAPAQKSQITKDYSENLKLYIKNFTDEQIIKLRTEVENNVYVGFRAEKLKKIILERYEVTNNKAKFLARQETSLLTSKYRELRYQQSGIRKYQWSTSHDSRVRHDHKELDGKIFSFDDPPVVNDRGDKKNPGEDFNCRCLAIPIIER
jgi:SPP1 gp7 family putative phage head morphogenesis protein